MCQAARVRTFHGTTDWFKIGKGVQKGYILSPCLFNLYAEYIMWNAKLDDSQAGIKIAGRNIHNLRYTDDTTVRRESEEEIKSFLMGMKRKVKKLAWNWTFRKLKILASSPITSFKTDRETMETATDFIFLGSKITVDGEIKRCFLLGRKAMTNLDIILKSRDNTLLTKVSIIKAFFFFFPSLLCFL